jgi:hypothetical protein
MKVNSDKGLALARKTLRVHGGSWSSVREAGTKRADGVIVVKPPPPQDKIKK